MVLSVIADAAAGVGTGFEGFDLLALALSAVAPFVVAGWWLARRFGGSLRAKRVSRP